MCVCEREREREREKERENKETGREEDRPTNAKLRCGVRQCQHLRDRRRK